MRYEVTQYPNGTTDLTLYDVTLLGATSSHPERSADVVSVGMSTSAFEALTHGEARRAMGRALDDAQKDVTRLTEERDKAKEQAELWRKLAERQDNTAPLRMELSSVTRERDALKSQCSLARDEIVRLRGLAPAEDDADELKATIVRQAREITRLKGESE